MSRRLRHLQLCCCTRQRLVCQPTPPPRRRRRRKAHGTRRSCDCAEFDQCVFLALADGGLLCLFSRKRVALLYRFLFSLFPTLPADASHLTDVPDFERRANTGAIAAKNNGREGPRCSVWRASAYSASTRSGSSVRATQMRDQRWCVQTGPALTGSRSAPSQHASEELRHCTLAVCGWAAAARGLNSIAFLNLTTARTGHCHLRRGYPDPPKRQESQEDRCRAGALGYSPLRALSSLSPASMRLCRRTSSRRSASSP